MDKSDFNEIVSTVYTNYKDIVRKFPKSIQSYYPQEALLNFQSTLAIIIIDLLFQDTTLVNDTITNVTNPIPLPPVKPKNNTAKPKKS